MGLISGEYDAKRRGGFRPDGARLHNIMSTDGPDSDTHEKASDTELKLAKVGEGTWLSFSRAS
jgi:homogentisate 1,2-dioxygenase